MSASDLPTSGPHGLTTHSPEETTTPQSSSPTSAQAASNMIEHGSHDQMTHSANNAVQGYTTSHSPASTTAEANSDQQDPTVSTSSKATGILDLPPEIFESVAKLLWPKDLIALRLMNREIETKVIDTFVKVHFSERIFSLYNKAGLQALYDIAAHRMFGKVMETVHLTLQRICDCGENQGSEEHKECSQEQIDFVEAGKVLATVFARLGESGREVHVCLGVGVGMYDLVVHTRSTRSVPPSTSFFSDNTAQLVCGL